MLFVTGGRILWLDILHILIALFTLIMIVSLHLIKSPSPKRLNKPFRKNLTDALWLALPAAIIVTKGSFFEGILNLIGGSSWGVKLTFGPFLWIFMLFYLTLATLFLCGTFLLRSKFSPKIIFTTIFLGPTFFILYLYAIAFSSNMLGANRPFFLPHFSGEQGLGIIIFGLKCALGFFIFSIIYSFIKYREKKLLRDNDLEKEKGNLM